jgi:membrane fusion protein (multidrug efflux system)
VEAGNKVRFQNVKVGPRVGNLWVIEEGLKPGDSVVVEGLQRVREGAVVTPKPLPPSSEGSGAAEPAAATAGEAK